MGGEKSSGAVPFGTLIALLVLCFGMNVPLVYIGAYISSKRPPLELPMRVKVHPREIPEQLWYTQAPFLALLGGILPFAACFIEIFFIIPRSGCTNSTTCLDSSSLFSSFLQLPVRKSRSWLPTSSFATRIIIGGGDHSAHLASRQFTYSSIP